MVNPTVSAASATFDAVRSNLDPSVLRSGKFVANGASGLSLNVTIAGTGAKNPAPLYGTWLAYVAEGYLSKLLTQGSAGTSAIKNFTMSMQLPDGTTVPNIGGEFGVAPQGLVLHNTMSDAQVEKLVTSMLPRYGLTTTSIHTFGPEYDALAIKSTVSDKAKASNSVGNLLYSLQQKNQFQGIYLEIDSASGSPVSVQDDSVQAGVGNNWAAPGFDFLRTTHG